VIRIFKRDILERSSILRSLRILPKENRTKVILATSLQVFLNILDLVGVATIGVLGALAVTGIQSQAPGNRVTQVLRLFRIEQFSFQTQVAILGLSACVILVFRTVLSIVITRRILFFLSWQGALITSNLFGRLLGQNLLQIQSRTSQETLYSLTAGVSSITLGILGATVTLIADGSLLLLLIAAMFLVDSTIAILCIIFFGTLGIVLYRNMSVRARDLGNLNSELTIKSNEKILEILESFRESTIRNTRQYYLRETRKARLDLAGFAAEMQFMPNVSKYVIESGMVVGAVMISGILFIAQDARHAIAALSVFLAAGTRIAPASLRLQQNLIQIRNSIGSAGPTFALIETLSDSAHLEETIGVIDRHHLDFNPFLKMNNVSFSYPSVGRLALNQIELELERGQSLAVVGPSGAGKTTLVDVLLGVLTQNSGEITISGQSPKEAIRMWPGAIAYVPQNVTIMNGTIRDNIALGFDHDEFTDQYVKEALEQAQLNELISQLPNGIDTQVGERGTKLSGGQRQRIGIARALFTKPLLLVLDEATSSLDGQTESEFSEAIKALHGQVSVVLIAHRLSTIRSADQVVYLSNGEIIARGNFEEVRKSVPDFDKQAELNGI
jgi:ABC-type multidrug transport system fused ATPase/permease subunit